MGLSSVATVGKVHVATVSNRTAAMNVTRVSVRGASRLKIYSHVNGVTLIWSTAACVSRPTSVKSAIGMEAIFAICVQIFGSALTAMQRGAGIA